MSIPNLIHKIKSLSEGNSIIGGIDKTTFLYLFIIVGVGIASFGFGRLSVVNNTENDNSTDIAIRGSIISNESKNTEYVESELSDQPKEKMYVASKSGKMYYTIGCSGSKRIKLENQIWFASASDAEKSGYSFSTSCK